MSRGFPGQFLGKLVFSSQGRGRVHPLVQESADHRECGQVAGVHGRAEKRGRGIFRQGYGERPRGREPGASSRQSHGPDVAQIRVDRGGPGRRPRVRLLPRGESGRERRPGDRRGHDAGHGGQGNVSRNRLRELWRVKMKKNIYLRFAQKVLTEK